MTTRTHIVALCIALLVALVVLRVVRGGGLRSKYTLLWLAVAVALAPLAILPGLLDSYSKLLGIHYPPTALLLTAMTLLFFIVIHYSWELSRTERRLRRLAEEMALLLDAADITRQSE